MQEVTLTIDKSRVWDEIAKATSYTGAKMMSAEDPGAYERIFTTDADRQMLERYWVEACSLATDTLKPWLSSVDNQPIHHGVDMTSDYEVTLSMSDRYDTTLTDSVQAALFSFFVSTILSKWYRLANKGETEAYASEAVAMLQTAAQKLYYKKKPTRVTS